MSVRLMVFDDDQLHRAKSGAVWGRIYFDLGDRTFPDKGWTDMVVAFLNAWLESLIRIAEGTSHREKVAFFDGPLSVDISSKDSPLATLDFIHKDVWRDSIVENTQELVRNSLSTGEALLDICRLHGWMGQGDTEDLVGLIQKGFRILSN